MSRHNPERVRTWRELIDAWKRSGQTINAFCRGRKLTRSNFDRWRRILAAEPGDTLYAVEREIQTERDKPDDTVTDAGAVRLRRTRAGPILATFADWLEEQRRHATPNKSIRSGDRILQESVAFARPLPRRRAV